MKVTKERVEEAIKNMDELIKDTLNESGLFDYSGTSLIENWVRVRECVSNKAVKIINNTVENDKKIVIRDWSFNKNGPIPELKLNEKEVGKTIDLEKSKSRKLVFMVK